MEWRNERSFDWNAWMRTVLLIGLTAFLLRLVITGDIKWYIHPRFTWFTASAAAGLILMAVGQVRKALRGVAWPGAPMRVRLYVAIATVLCVGFVFRPVVFGADLASKQGMNLTKRGATPAPVPPVTETPVAGTAPATKPPQAEAPAPAAPPPAAPVVSGPPIEVTTKNFVTLMNDFYGTPAQFAGRRITMEGFVFHPPETKPGEWALTRLVVTCHVTHAFPDGLLVLVPGQDAPEQDKWFRVEGVLEPVTHMGVNTLRINVEKISSIPEPPEPYVYP